VGARLERVGIIKQTTELDAGRQSVGAHLERVGIIKQTTEAGRQSDDERVSEMESCDGVKAGRRRPARQPLQVLCHVLLGYLALLAAFRIVVQGLVHVSELRISRFALEDPWDSSAATVVEGTIALPILLPVLAILDISQLDVMYDGRALGALRPEAPVSLGHGGTVAVSLSGRMYVLEPRAFRALADALLHRPHLDLELQSQVLLPAF